MGSRISASSRRSVVAVGMLVVALSLTTACGGSTARSHTATTTATSLPTATATATLQSGTGQVSAYVGAGDRVYALDGRTGKVRWSYTTGHGTALGGIDSVALMGGTVFAHGTGGTGTDGYPTRTLYALDPATGALRWTLQSPNSQASAPVALASAEPVAVSGGVLYLVAESVQAPHGTYAVDLKTGTVLWAAESIAGGIAIDDRAVYVAQTFASSAIESPSDGQLTALYRMTGKTLWQLRGHTYGDVLLSGGTLYVTVTSGPTPTLSALDPATSATRWTTPVNSPNGYVGVQIAGGALYVADQSGVSALDPSTGNRRWRITAPADPGIEGDGATLCLSYRDQSSYHLAGVDAATGVLRWAVQGAVPPGGYGGGSGFGGGACYARTDLPNAAGSTIRRADDTSGATRWIVDAGGQVVDALNIYSDAIFVNTSSVQRHAVVKALSVADGSTMWSFTPDGDFPGTLAVG